MPHGTDIKIEKQTNKGRKRRSKFIELCRKQKNKMAWIGFLLVCCFIVSALLVGCYLMSATTTVQLHYKH